MRLQVRREFYRLPPSPLQQLSVRALFFRLFIRKHLLRKHTWPDAIVRAYRRKTERQEVT